jgi:uncharacterized protein YndB with AHSA1/START domain
MLMTVLLVVVVALAALAGFIATRPADFRLVRSRRLAAPPRAVFDLVNDFHRWPEWSPWEKLDPHLKRELSGPASGTGAAYHWSGNAKAGEGRMTITDSQPPSRVTIRLEFIKPWTATNTTTFDFAPSGGGTDVTWAMAGTNNFMMKAFSLFMDMEKAVGPDFERGLASLDAATSPPGGPKSAA